MGASLYIYKIVILTRMKMYHMITPLIKISSLYKDVELFYKKCHKSVKFIIHCVWKPEG